MNKLVIPPPPGWYENILACAPDNTVIYASRNDLVIISPKPPEEPADIKIVYRCHRDKIIGTAVNPNWGNPDKLAVSIGEDKVVNLLDIEMCKVKLAHSGHTTRSDKLVGVTFAGHDRVISVSEDGFIVIWRWANNQLNSLSDLLGSKVKVTCISSCPHASWLTAFGLRRGEIIVTDLRRAGRVLYRLRGHDSNIISLSWCPTPYNIFPKSLPKRGNDSISRKTEKSTESNRLLDTSANTSSKSEKENRDINIESIVETIVSNYEKVTEDINPIDVKETISPKLETKSDSVTKEDPTENTSPEFEKTTEDVNPVNTEESQTECTEDITAIAPTKVINKTENTNISSDQESLEAPKPEIVKTEADSSDLVIEYNLKKLESNEQASEELIEESHEELKESQLNIKHGEADIVEESSEKPKLPLPGCDSKEEVAPDEPLLEVQNSVEEQSLPLHETNENQESQGKTNAEVKENLPDGNNALEDENEKDTGENVHDQFEMENEPAKEYLLASSARGGRSIIIWRAGTDGIKQAELNLPAKHRGNQRSYQQEEKSWITLCWVTPKNLLSSSPKGELLQWNLTTGTNIKGIHKSRLIHSDHNKHLFGIAAPIRLHESPDDEDWRDKNLLNAWTVGKDRLVLNTSLCAERKTLASYPTICGAVNCLASSVTYPSKIAIGGGEGSCRLWDLSRPHLQYIVMTQFSDRSQHKIVSLAWHPTKETILAFGTVDGRVGLMDPCNCSKQATFLVQHASSAVHRLDWGPLNGNHENFVLFAVIGGKLISYDVNKRLDAPTVFDIENVTQISWKPDYSVCAVATKAGHVLLFSPEFKLVTTFYVQNKSVRWITWHPEATTEDDGVSPYANWLAVAANDVTVYDCSLSDDSSAGKDYSERVVAVFSEQTKFVECMSWSTFEGGKLASASDTGIASVWDVKTKTLLHSCVIPNEDIFTSVLWSPLDPDYIITGSRNSTIQIWKLSENPPQEKLVKRQQRKMLKLKEVETLDTNGDADAVEEIEKPKKGHRKYVLGGLIEAHDRNSPPVLLRDCKRLFAKHYGMSQYDNELQNAEIEDDKHLDILKVFGNDENIDIVLNLEQHGNSKKKISRSSSHISIWRGDTATAVKDAIRTKTLNPWMISMAPTVSHDLYLEACEAYANHLSEDVQSNAYEIASYYLACHKLEKAIDILCNTTNFLEALVLAKCRLVPPDPLITNVIERWAKHSIKCGIFEVAAQCYIALNRLEEAANVLFKRTDKNTLEFCAELAKHCDNKNFLDAVLFKLSSCEATKDDENPEMPLLTRAEVEINRLKLDNENRIDNDDINSKGDAIDASYVEIEINDNKSNFVKENGVKIFLGDAQCVNNSPSDDAIKQNVEDVTNANDEKVL